MHSAFTVMSLTFVYDFKEDFQLVWVCVCVCVYVYACECVISTYPSNVEDSVQIIYFKWSVWVYKFTKLKFWSLSWS